MSSGIESPILYQIGDVINLLQDRKRDPAFVSRALQAVIGDHVITVHPKVTVDATGKIFHVTGSFNSMAEAIAATRCELKWGAAEKPETIPAIIQPVDCRVRAIPLGRLIKTGEIFSLFPRVVDPLTLFSFGAKFPEEQREAPHFTIWMDVNSQFWWAILDVHGGQRVVSVRRGDPVGGWDDDCRVLVLEFLSAA